MGLFSSQPKIFTAWKKGPKNRPPFEAFYVYALALAAGFMISDLGILYVRPALLPTEAPPMKPARQIRQQFTSIDQYNRIRDRNVFNQDGKIPPPLTSDGAPSGPETAPVASQLPLKLEGTLVHANPKRSVATITPKSKGKAESYMVDAEIENMARITKIERRRVVFRNLNNQRLEFIEIPRDAAITMKVKDPGAKTGEVQKRGEFEFSMSRKDIMKYTADLGSVLQQARMVPNIVPGSGGRVEGFRFVAIQPGSIYEKLGFKPDDVIKAVNGEPVDSPARAMELYNALSKESRINLTVNRGGRDESFKYEIPD
jgi:general secretion pathway protein C